MPKQIWKYKHTKSSEIQEIKIPTKAEVVHVETIDNQIYLWAEIQQNKPDTKQFQFFEIEDSIIIKMRNRLGIKIKAALNRGLNVSMYVGELM